MVHFTAVIQLWSVCWNWQQLWTHSRLINNKLNRRNGLMDNNKRSLRVTFTWVLLRWDQVTPFWLHVGRWSALGIKVVYESNKFQSEMNVRPLQPTMKADFVYRHYKQTTYNSLESDKLLAWHYERNSLTFWDIPSWELDEKIDAALMVVR